MKSIFAIVAITTLVILCNYSCKKEEVNWDDLQMGPDFSDVDSAMNSPIIPIDEVITPYFSNMKEGSKYYFKSVSTNEMFTFEVKHFNYTPNLIKTGKDIFRHDEYSIKFMDDRGFKLDIYLDENDNPITNLLEYGIPSTDLIEVKDGKFVPECVEILENFELQGKVYDKVLHIPEGCYLISPGNSSEYWFAAGVGIIKLKGSLTLELVDHEIND